MPLLAISTLLLTLILPISYFCYRQCFYSPPQKHNDPYEPLVGQQFLAVETEIFRVTGIMERYSFEDVSATAPDGTPLRARYYHLADGAPLMILCHGYRSSALRDCSGGHLLSRKLGFNALVIHQRAHGESGGTAITFGIREREDLHSWIRYANDRFGTDVPIIVYGISMGAATVLMGAELDYPSNVACIMADSPYSSPADIILKVCKDMGYPPKLAYPFVWLGALIFGHFRLDACSAREAVRHSRIPILLIHGEDDRLVPVEMSNLIARACTCPCQVYTFPNAGHGLCYLTDPQRFERVVFDFLNHIPAVSRLLSDSFKETMNRPPEKL